MFIVTNKTIWRYVEKIFLVFQYPIFLHNSELAKVNHLECIYLSHTYL